MALVENIGICRLGGFVGSNPEILDSYPPFNQSLDEKQQREIILKSIPEGSQPDSYTVSKLGSKVILSYIYKIQRDEEGTRSDLASITLVVSEKRVNILELQKLFKAIIESFQGEMSKLTKTLLRQLMERIYNGVNKNTKISVQDIEIDIPKIIKRKRLKIVRKTESLAGRVM